MAVLAHELGARPAEVSVDLRSHTCTCVSEVEVSTPLVGSRIVAAEPDAVRPGGAAGLELAASRLLSTSDESVREAAAFLGLR